MICAKRGRGENFGGWGGDQMRTRMAGSGRWMERVSAPDRADSFADFGQSDPSAWKRFFFFMFRSQVAGVKKKKKKKKKKKGDIFFVFAAYIAITFGGSCLAFAGGETQYRKRN